MIGKLLLIVTLLSMLTSCGRARPKLGGNGAGNGGDPEQALTLAGMQTDVAPPNRFLVRTTEYYRRDFYVMASRALWALKLRLELSDEPPGLIARRISESDLTEARDLLNAICLTHPDRFSLGIGLFAQGEAVTALNFSGTVRLDPARWDLIEARYPQGQAIRLKGMLALHEILSLLKRPLEHTRYYPISLQVYLLPDATYPSGSGDVVRLFTVGEETYERPRDGFATLYTDWLRTLLTALDKLPGDSPAAQIRWNWLKSVRAEMNELRRAAIDLKNDDPIVQNLARLDASANVRAAELSAERWIAAGSPRGSRPALVVWAYEPFDRYQEPWANPIAGSLMHALLAADKNGGIQVDFKHNVVAAEEIRCLDRSDQCETLGWDSQKNARVFSPMEVAFGNDPRASMDLILTPATRDTFEQKVMASMLSESEQELRGRSYPEVSYHLGFDLTMSSIRCEESSVAREPRFRCSINNYNKRTAESSAAPE